MRRHNVVKMDFIEEADMTQDIKSETLKVDNLDKLKFLISWMGDAVGEFKLYISDDAEKFYEIELDGEMTVGGLDGYHIANIMLVNFTYIQLQYLHTSGSGILNVSYKGLTSGA